MCVCVCARVCVCVLWSTFQKVFEVPQDRVVLTADCQKQNAGLPDSIFMVRHIHHMGEWLGGHFGMAAAHHHMEATAQQANGQALGEVTWAQDGHSGLGRQTSSPSISSSALHAVAEETTPGMVEVVGGGGCKEQRAPAAAHHSNGVHPSSLSLPLQWFYAKKDFSGSRG